MAPYNIPGDGNFFMGVGQYYISLNFGRGSIFPGEFSDIIAFLLPNIFGKPRTGVGHPGGGLSKGYA